MFLQSRKKAREKKATEDKVYFTKKGSRSSRGAERGKRRPPSTKASRNVNAAPLPAYPYQYQSVQPSYPPQPQQTAKVGRQSKGTINYETLQKKGSWLEKYNNELQGLKDLALSGSFEAMEKAVTKTEEKKKVVSNDDSSKIVDTLDLSQPKDLINEVFTGPGHPNYKGTNHGGINPDQILTKEFMTELGLGKNNTANEMDSERQGVREAFDCDVSALKNEVTQIDE